MTRREALQISPNALPGAVYVEEEDAWVGPTAWDLLRQAERQGITCLEAGGSAVRFSFSMGDDAQRRVVIL